MSLPDSALLFAAGLGTRMRPLTDSTPKPLVEVAGKPLIGHALALLRDAGISQIAANTHYMADRLSPFLQSEGISESFEPVLLDTGGGLKAALPLLPGDAAITLNTDAVWTGSNPLRSMLKAWDPERMDCLMALVPRGNAEGHLGKGDFLMDATGRLTAGPGLVYSGLQIVRTEPFLSEAETVFSMHLVWRQLLQAGRIFGHVHVGGWCDVGHPPAIAVAEAMLEQDRV